MSNVTRGLWTGCVSFKQFVYDRFPCRVCRVRAPLAGTSHHTNPFNLTIGVVFVIGGSDDPAA